MVDRYAIDDVLSSPPHLRLISSQAVANSRFDTKWPAGSRHRRDAAAVAHTIARLHYMRRPDIVTAAAPHLAIEGWLTSGALWEYDSTAGATASRWADFAGQRGRKATSELYEWVSRFAHEVALAAGAITDASLGGPVDFSDHRRKLSSAMQDVFVIRRGPKPLPCVSVAIRSDASVLMPHRDSAPAAAALRLMIAAAAMIESTPQSPPAAFTAARFRESVETAKERLQLGFPPDYASAAAQADAAMILRMASTGLRADNLLTGPTEANLRECLDR